MGRDLEGSVVSADAMAAAEASAPAEAPAPAEASLELSEGQLGRVQRLQVIVKEETPVLPRVAFVLITLASLAGAVFAGDDLGIHGFALFVRWFALWTMALSGGFLTWRLVYLHRSEKEIDQPTLNALIATALGRAQAIGRGLAPLVAVGSAGALAAGYLDNRPALRAVLVAAALVLAVLLGVGVRNRGVAMAAALAVVVLIAGWAYADGGSGSDGWLHLAHLTAFTLWLGGALWNICVQIPSGRRHPTIDAVLAGARQLDRFRWVVRFALPTIVITGVTMADAFRSMPGSWWLEYPGVLIPVKVLLIVALIAVFIACPLFRQCSPVQGVCNVDDLRKGDAHPDKVSQP